MSDAVAPELREAVLKAASAHAARLTRGRSMPSDCGHLLQALREEPAGIHPKVRLALESIVKHVVYLESRLKALERKEARRP
jgi:hypothetical protein